MSQPTASPVPPSLRLLNDRPVVTASEDLLGLDAYAGALADLIASTASRRIAEPPFTVAVHAPWGAGKSSLARLLQRRLEGERVGERSHLVCWFNAWDHLAATDPNGALVAAVARTASGARGWTSRVLWPLPAALLDPAGQRRRRTALVLVLLVLGASVAAIATWAAVDRDDGGWNWATALAAVLAGLAGLKAVIDGLFPSWASLSSYVRGASAVAGSGSLGAVQHRLRKLVGSVTRSTWYHVEERRLVVIVDDLDRCPPGVALALSATCAQLLSVEGLVVVLLGDLSAIEAEATRQFGSGAADGADADVGRRYVEKIFQYRVDLPMPRSDQVRRLTEPARLTSAGTGPGRSTPKRRAQAAWHGLFALSPLRQVVLVGLAVLLVALIAVSGQFDGGFKWVVVLMATVLLLVSGKLYSMWTAQARARSERAVHDDIDARVLAGEYDIDTIADAVGAGLDTRAGRLWPRDTVLALAGEAVAATTALAILAYAKEAQSFADDESRNPRLHKRLVNQSILAYLVAARRRLLPSLSPDLPMQIAKWSVLGTLWPALREGIQRQPDAFVREEAYLRADGRATVGFAPGVVRFVRSGPALGPVIEQLLTMSPAADGGGGEAGAPEVVR